jgi:hypothetical protein
VSTARRVRRVRLAAPRDDLVRRGAVLLEDALRTASVPAGDGGRLVLVRSLDVGRIRPGASPAALSLIIEARLREAGALAVHALGADDGAPAVFFRDAGEAAALLCVRLARGGEAGAWFWRAAVPGWSPALGPADGIRLALRTAAESAPGAVAVAHVLRIALEHGALDRVLATVDPDTAAWLAARAGWSMAKAPRRAGDPSEDAPPPVPREWRVVLERWIAAWGGEDARSAWLAAAALVDERPTRAADPHLPHRARRIVASVLRPPYPFSRTGERRSSGDAEWRSSGDAERRSSGDAERRPSGDDDRPSAVSSDAGQPSGDGDRSTSPDSPDAPPAIHADPHRPEPVGARSGDVDPTADLYELDGVDAIHRADDPASPLAAPPSADPPSADSSRDGDPIAGEAAPMTVGAGLFFLIPAMERLGMAEFVAHHPALLEADLPARVLLRIAARLRVPADDAAVRALGLDGSRGGGAAGDPDGPYAPAASPPEGPYTFAAPAGWARAVVRPGAEVVRPRGDGRTATRDASGRLLVADESAALGEIVDAWVVALRRWCRRHARMGLRALVLRRGRVAFTRTHVDVTMPLSAADVRVRAAGLDLDPGWVPWLGRVVAFHYED